MKKKKKIIIFLTILLAITPIFPVKFTRKEEDIPDDRLFYIASCISEASTEGGTWVIIDSNDPIIIKAKREVSVNFVGKNPKNLLSYDICNSYTEFIIYGNLTKKENEKWYTLHSKKWEIFDEVKRGDYQLRIPFKHFITIYDLRLFDFLFTDEI